MYRFCGIKKINKSFNHGLDKRSKKTAVFNETQITLMIITPKSGTMEGKKKVGVTIMKENEICDSFFLIITHKTN